MRWLNSESSRSALGYQAKTRWLETALLTCHPSNRPGIEARIASARNGEGPTLFDDVVGIIRDHGPGGDEAEDGILLELL
ncbi:barnase inhibitor [Kutzneria buriramensis]|uniref:barnase inhibitor n=1 Tax=Kutzneria buriramensis TaxID=1045776 RepID=UPI001FE5334E|nr:barnase inhibitor [Kutzneria buriramensis]